MEVTQRDSKEPPPRSQMSQGLLKCLKGFSPRGVSKGASVVTKGQEESLGDRAAASVSEPAVYLGAFLGDL